ncbi:MAG TPA: hypothetical protein DIT07_05045 [Sphingobacteriaceae bacterium]|nr:hypothetical protein [Sphingobacteriaceae bacterium]
MVRKLSLSLALIFSVVLITMAADLISGSWKGKLVIGNGERALTYNLKADGEKLSGNITSEQGEIPIYDGKVIGESISFKIDVNGTVIPHEGKVSGDTLNMKLIVQGNVIEGKFAREKTTYIDNVTPKKVVIE